MAIVAIGLDRAQVTRPWPIAVSGGWDPDPSTATIATLERGGSFKFHGIVSRGVLDAWKRMGWASERGQLDPRAAWWPECAPLLEHCWNASQRRASPAAAASEMAVAARLLDRTLRSHGVRLDRHYSQVPDEVAVGMAAAALRARLLSRHQAIAAAAEHVARALDADVALASGSAETPIARDDGSLVWLEPLKEGHTSSVIRVGVVSAGAALAYGLNVARDLTSAAVELKAVHRHLRAAAALDPDGVIRLGELAVGECRRFGRTVSVPVIPMAWVEEAREIHVVRDGSNPQRGRILIVDEFLPDPVARGSVRGERVGTVTSNAIWAAIAAARTRQARIDLQGGFVDSANVELNDGDFVLSSGVEHQVTVTLVATSLERTCVPLGAWPYDLALMSARDETDPAAGRLRWGDPALALVAMREALEGRSGGSGIEGRMLEAAAHINNADLAHALLIDADDSYAWHLVAAVRDLAGSPASAR